MPAFSPAILHTERLTLRWVDANDTAAQYSLYSNPEVVRYWSGGPWTEMAQAEESIAQSLASYQDGSAMRFVVVLRATGEVIGNVSLFAIAAASRRAEAGYALAAAHRGKGYLMEAMTAMLDYAFGELGLNRLEADADPRNLPSVKALERLKFRQEGLMRQRWIVNGEVSDTAFYGLLASDWLEARAR